MSVVELDGRRVVDRVYYDGDPLPTPWEPLRTLKESDIVHRLDDQETNRNILPEHHGAVEGLGWVMMDSSFEKPEAILPSEEVVSPIVKILRAGAETPKEQMIKLPPEIFEDIPSLAVYSTKPSASRAA